MATNVHTHQLLRELRGKGIRVGPGLTSSELERAEERVGSPFPPDLVDLLATGLLVGERFPNWRALDSALDAQLRWPLEGICFDIEHNAFWLDGWGQRPDHLQDAVAVAVERLAHAPTLIPLYGHRYLPAEPSSAGNPVFSVYQTDIIVYGADLASYFATEFEFPAPAWAQTSPRRIRFWSDLTS